MITLRDSLTLLISTVALLLSVYNFRRGLKTDKDARILLAAQRKLDLFNLMLDHSGRILKIKNLVESAFETWPASASIELRKQTEEIIAETADMHRRHLDLMDQLKSFNPAAATYENILMIVDQLMINLLANDLTRMEMGAEKLLRNINLVKNNTR